MRKIQKVLYSDNAELYIREYSKIFLRVSQTMNLQYYKQQN